MTKLRVWISNKIGKHPDERRIDVSCGLGFPEISTVVVVHIILPRPSNHCPNQRIRIRARRVEIHRAPSTWDRLRVVLDRGQGGTAMVDALGVPVPVPYHVGHTHRVVSQDVINLPFRLLSQPIRAYVYVAAI